MRADNVVYFRRHQRRAPRLWTANAPALAALVIVLGLTPLNEPRAPGPLPLPKVLQGGKAWRGSGPSGKPATSAKPMRRISGRASRVYDGDTIAIGGVPVRFAKLDCAEAGTSRGNAATRRMAQLAASGKLTCSLTGRRSYKRWIGSCTMSDGRDMGEVMIREGYCRRWR